MMTWNLIFLPEADDDFNSLDLRRQLIVDTAIKRVLQNLLPQSESGYGKPLGLKGGRNLTGFLKIKLKGEGIRIAYQLIRTRTTMRVVVVGVGEDDEVYKMALKRKEKYGL